jgi:hypothetical protein
VNVGAAEQHGFFISATILDIDRQTGRVSLETGGGIFSALVPAEELAKLREGDVIAIYVTEDTEPPTMQI